MKYLGIYIDDKLSFNFHISQLVTKIAKTIGIISKLRYFSNLAILKQVYYALIYPHLIYGIVIWGNSRSSYLTQLQNKQNKIVNIMHFSPHGRLFDPLSYKRSNILKIGDLCLIQSATFLFDFKNGNLPPIFNNYFKLKSENCNIRTRNNIDSYYLEFTQTKFAKLCIKSNAVAAWDSVPNILKKLSKKHIFKKQLQKHILKAY